MDFKTSTISSWCFILSALKRGTNFHSRGFTNKTLINSFWKSWLQKAGKLFRLARGCTVVVQEYCYTFYCGEKFFCFVHRSHRTRWNRASCPQVGRMKTDTSWKISPTWRVASSLGQCCPHWALSSKIVQKLSHAVSFIQKSITMIC